MLSRNRVLILLLALVLGISIAESVLTKTIGGETYQQLNGVWHVQDQDGEFWEIAPNIIEIKFNENVSEAQRDTFATNHELVLSPVIIPDGYYRYEYEEEADPTEVLAGVLDSPIVDGALLDTYLKFLSAPNDPFYNQVNQWNLHIMNLEKAWDITTGDSPISIAVIDVGVDRTHQDLNGNLWANPHDSDDDGDDDDEDWRWYGQPGLIDDYWGWDFTNRDNEPLPMGKHGTAVAGMAVANRDNSKGIASIAGGRESSRPIKWASVISVGERKLGDALRYCDSSSTSMRTTL